MIDKAAQGKVSVLLLGETGVGKEVIARSVHSRSERSESPFVAVNCAAIPPDLIEAELFGVEKGAFTGANQSRPGRFERANNGTIFLDEVVELTPRAQASLLRVLQESELERVGDNRTRSVNVRIIAATNENLAEAVEAGKFRADLYYRLNVFPVQLPPLRDRVEDLPLLAEHFLRRFEVEYNKRTLGLSDKALELCLRYRWPGNIRELENVIERGVILTDSNECISHESLFTMLPDSEFQQSETHSSEVIGETGQVIPGDSPNRATDWAEGILNNGISLDDVENTLIKRAMEQANNNVSEASRILGLTRPALAYRLKKVIRSKPPDKAKSAGSQFTFGLRHPCLEARTPEVAASEVNHRANALTLVHQIKGLIDVLQRHFVGNKHIQWNLTCLGFFNIAW